MSSNMEICATEMEFKLLEDQADQLGKTMDNLVVQSNSQTHPGQVIGLQNDDREVDFRTELLQLIQGQGGDQTKSGFQNQGQRSLFTVPKMLSSHSLTDCEVGNLEIEKTPTPRPKTPIEIPEVLDMVMSKLDRKSLHAGRLVCKRWNDSWIRVISKHPAPPTIDLDGKSITKFYGVIKKSKSLDKSVLHLKFCFSEQFGKKIFQKLLGRLGWNLKFLTLTKCCDRNFPLLLSALGELCPNLEDMTILTCNSTYCDPFQSSEYFEFPVTRVTGLLSRLKRITFCFKKFRTWHVEVLVSAVRASPNLKYLKMKSLYKPDTSGRVFQSLQNLPEITLGLEQLQINCTWSHEILGIKLSNLKSLELNIGVYFKKNEFAQLLQNIKFSLETLTLNRNSSRECMNMNDYDWGLSLPMMAKLKIFKNFAYAQVPIKPQELTKVMPNLETLVIALGPYHHRKKGDYIFSANTSWDRIPHLTLKKLVINQEIMRAETLACINETFPNLTQLFVSLWSVDDEIDCTPYLQEVFQRFSEMNNMRHLTISFIWIGLNGRWKVHDAFAKLKELPCLQQLTIVNKNCGWRDPINCPEFVNAVVGLLGHAPKLRAVTLVNFQFMACIDKASFKMLLEGFRRTAVCLDFTTASGSCWTPGIENDGWTGL